MTPKPSTRQRFACATTSAGMLASVVFVMKAVSASVAPLIAAFSTFVGLLWPRRARGKRTSRRGAGRREFEEVLACDFH